VQSTTARLALQDGSLELRQGEILGLRSPQRAGQDDVDQDSGTVLHEGRRQVDILGYDLDRHVQVIRHLFGYVGQDTERSPTPG
jgi:ABC-type sugar transport system ATPase subunit